MAISDLTDRGGAASRRGTITGSLDLAIGDLINGATTGGRSSTTSRRGIGTCAPSRSSSRSLNLVIGDLANLAPLGNLDLTIGNLGDRTGVSSSSSRSLNLSVGDLRDGTRGGTTLGSTIGGSLDLAVVDLTDSSAGLGGRLRLDASCRAAGGRVAIALDPDVDWLTLRGPVAVIQVVELARAALVEDLGGTKGQVAVVASREARGSEGASLRRTVELELVVIGDITSSLLLVGKDTVL